VFVIANRESQMAPPAPLALVVAMAKNRCIGRDGGLPWHISEDLKYFKRVTTGHAILMGRKTWESIGRPLPNRRNVVITRQALAIPGVDVAPDLASAIRVARQGGDAEPRIVGGGSIYAAALPLATTLYVTEIDEAVAGDTFFPAWDPAEWREVSRTPGKDPRVTFVVYERNP
jgi:dihydrofolate reductase